MTLAHTPVLKDARLDCFSELFARHSPNSVPIIAGWIRFVVQTSLNIFFAQLVLRVEFESGIKVIHSRLPSGLPVAFKTVLVKT